MDYIYYLIDFVLNIKIHMNTIVNNFGLWTYVLLFFIIFCETGLVIMPILPGDSLLFAIGIVSSVSYLNVHFIVILLSIAAILGDNVNYWIGSMFGEKLFNPKAKILKTSHLKKTHEFFEKYGSKAIFIARFIPIIRTFIPFAAGIGKTSYKRFITLSSIAAFIWVGSIVYLGYFFKNLSFINKEIEFLFIICFIVLFFFIFFQLFKKNNLKK